MANRWHLPAGTTGSGPVAVEVAPESAGWSHTGLRVVEVPAGGTHTIDTAEFEMLVLPLAGSCRVTCEDATLDLHGRSDVFARVTDFAYLPTGSEVELASEQGGRFALPAAVASRRLPFRYGAAEDVPVELRGAGLASRQVTNFCTPGVFDADALIACEVITPGGNWSSYPPHKHDEESVTESELEEIYYFEVAGGPQAMGYHRVYGTAERPIDVLAEVRTGDVVLVPYGWHGPSTAPPGYDLYYLNAMAGPGERAWRIRDDPAHAWVRDGWADEQVDPRLPMTSATGRAGSVTGRVPMETRI